MALQYAEMDAPIGKVFIASTGDKICGITMGGRAWANLLNQFEQLDLGKPQNVSNSVLVQAKKQLQEYFKGKRQEFNLPLFQQGTTFQLRVWDELLTIPYGRLISYGELANRLGKPGGMRAVGAANGQNKIPILVPCHRVIASDGSLGGYAGGLEVKRHLLELETSYTTPTLF
jgi:O-6-methylguanine DNA methyltransferase